MYGIYCTEARDLIKPVIQFPLQYFPTEGIKIFGNLLHTHLVGKKVLD